MARSSSSSSRSLTKLEAAKGVLLPPEKPFVAFEHSTMRTLPFEDSVRGRLLNLAYRVADYCVITNPDVVLSAKRLGLTRYRFIPHPIDETKYAPPAGPDTPLRKEILEATRSELIWGTAYLLFALYYLKTGRVVE